MGILKHKRYKYIRYKFPFKVLFCDYKLLRSTIPQSFNLFLTLCRTSLINVSCSSLASILSWLEQEQTTPWRVSLRETSADGVAEGGIYRNEENVEEGWQSSRRPSFTKRVSGYALRHVRQSLGTPSRSNFRVCIVVARELRHCSHIRGITVAVADQGTLIPRLYPCETF